MALLKFNIWIDAGLTTPLSGDQDISHQIGAAANVDKTYYIGATDTYSTWMLEATSNPGVDQIVVSLSDATTSSGPETSHYKLALTLLGLDTAIAGDPLNVATTINGGVSNAIAIFVRASEPPASGTDITFALNEADEHE